MTSGQEREIALLRSLAEKHGLLGPYETGQAAGIFPQNINVTRDFPEPIAENRSGRIWIGTEVREFGDALEQRRKQQEQARAAAA